MSKKSKPSSSSIAVNRKATHRYFIEEHFTAGVVLQGWEVKALRAGKVQISESHVVIRKGEAWLLNSVINPLQTASTHIIPEPSRTRKLLLNRSEINRLIGATERDGYTIVPLKLFWKGGRVKADIGLAKGKKQHDKRASEKKRDWDREKARILSHKT